MKIAVIHGGNSTEKLASTLNAEHVDKALIELGHESYLLEFTHDIATKLKEHSPDAVFLCVQGKHHGDGTLQAILDQLHIPYTGSKRKAATLINNKILCQELFSFEGVPIASSFTWSEHSHKSENAEQLFLEKMKTASCTFPCLAKAPTQGGSFGIVYLTSIENLPAISPVFQYDDTLLIESFVVGDFYTVSLLHDNDKLLVFPPVKGQMMNNNAQFTSFTGEFTTSLAELPQEISDAMMEYAEKTHKYVGAYGYSRVDMMLDSLSNELKILEINAVPGLKPTSLFPSQLAFFGFAYLDVIDKVLGSIKVIPIKKTIRCQLPD